jgi:DNA primase large subunit
MIRQDFNRIDAKRRSTLGHRQKQFAQPAYQELEYPHRLNFYTVSPTADITLEQFEQWAIDRLRGIQISTFCSLWRSIVEYLGN